MSLAVLIVVATTRSRSTLPGEAGTGELDKDVPSIPDRAPAIRTGLRRVRAPLV